jgi:hypothetical protein
VVALLVTRASAPTIAAFVIGLTVGAFVSANWYEYHFVGDGDDIAVLASHGWEPVPDAPALANGITLYYRRARLRLP